jgi:hypothetical protein
MFFLADLFQPIQESELQELFPEPFLPSAYATQNSPSCGAANPVAQTYWDGNSKHKARITVAATTVSNANRSAFGVKAAGSTSIHRLGLVEGTNSEGQCGGADVRHGYLPFSQLALPRAKREKKEEKKVFYSRRSIFMAN